MGAGQPRHRLEQLDLVALLGAGLVFMQLERLVIPRVLTYEDLATFGVVSSLVASPFRMLQNAVFYTIIPRLRGAPPVEERRRQGGVTRGGEAKRTRHERGVDGAPVLRDLREQLVEEALMFLSCRDCRHCLSVLRRSAHGSPREEP